MQGAPSSWATTVAVPGCCVRQTVQVAPVEQLHQVGRADDDRARRDGEHGTAGPGRDRVQDVRSGEPVEKLPCQACPVGGGDDFTRFVSTGTSLTDGVTELAHIDWQSVITTRDAGLLPCSSGESRILRLAASIAVGIPVDLNDALSGLDQSSIALVVRAVRHANGQRPADFDGS
jgi:hypothetical protein